MAARFSLRLRHIGLSRNPEAPMRRVDGRRAVPTPLSESGRVEGYGRLRVMMAFTYYR